MVDARQKIAERLAELYDRPIGRFTALVEYFDGEDIFTLKEAVKRHVENDTWTPTVASITEQIRQIHMENNQRRATKAQESRERIPGMADFMRQYTAEAGQATKRHAGIVKYLRTRYHIHGDIDSMFVSEVCVAIRDRETYKLPDRLSDYEQVIDEIYATYNITAPQVR